MNQEIVLSEIKITMKLDGEKPDINISVVKKLSDNSDMNDKNTSNSEYALPNIGSGGGGANLFYLQTPKLSKNQIERKINDLVYRRRYGLLSELAKASKELWINPDRFIARNFSNQGVYWL